MDAILAFLQNESIAAVLAMVVGLIYKFFPAFRNWTNKIIPIITVVVAWLAHVFVVPDPVVAGGIGAVIAAPAGIFVRSVIDSLLARFLFEKFLREPTDGKKPLPDPKPA